MYRQFESKCQDGGQIYTQTEWESRKLNYLINYEGLNADNYYDYENPNPTYYEWSAADPQNVTLAEPTLPGYEFLGWTGLDVTEPAKNFTFSSSVCQNVTVTAHWKPVIYTITYDLDGGSFYAGNTPNTEYSRGGQPSLIIPATFSLVRLKRTIPLSLNFILTAINIPSRLKVRTAAKRSGQQKNISMRQSVNMAATFPQRLQMTICIHTFSTIGQEVSLTAISVIM